MKTSVLALSVCALVCSSSFSFAANQDTTQFNIKITIKETCNISSQEASDIDFGSINRSSSDVSAQGNLNVTCTSGTPYNIALKSNRVMSNSLSNSSSIPYMLYQDSAQNVVWGTDSSSAYTNTGNGSTQQIGVWGKVFRQNTNVPAGSYADTVTAVISY